MPLHFEFNVDKENNQIRVSRTFDAGIDLVWAAWTTAELLDQWWAPQPYRNKTKTLNFREGGYWLYAMLGPKEEMHWARFDYESISDKQSYSGKDAFCDEEGSVNNRLPGMNWHSTFSEADGRCTVNILIKAESAEALENIIKMGFKEGFSMGLDQLDILLARLKTK